MDRKPIRRWLVLTPADLQFATLPEGKVAIRCHFQDDAIGLAEGISLAIQMTPKEARRTAHLLLKEADLAETGHLPPQ